MGMLVNPYRTSAVAGDPSFGNVLILAHFNGTNGGGGPFTNSATATGAPQLEAVSNLTYDTSVFMFGTSSLKAVSAVGGAIVNSPALTSQCDIGTGDFTLEFWFYDPSGGTGRDIDYGTIAVNPTTSFGMRHTSNTMRFEFNGTDRITSGAVLVNSTFQHIAVTRASGVTKTFIDGTQAGSNYTDGNTYTGTGAKFYLGRNSNGNSSNNVRYDELRLTVGVARYTANFTPPVAAFPDS